MTKAATLPASNLIPPKPIRRCLLWRELRKRRVPAALHAVKLYDSTTPSTLWPCDTRCLHGVAGKRNRARELIGDSATK
jgi:hypothetical protein